MNDHDLVGVAYFTAFRPPFVRILLHIALVSAFFQNLRFFG